ncbi:hypothetical protein HDV00_007203 [Rhizophlyctis rosea]|nr:hypothetical protein HDV00_007203 [Rhizophlyctis rosea]
MLASAVETIVAENSTDVALKCLTTLHSMAQNLMRDAQKYGTLKGTSQRLNEDVINVEGGLDALLALGFTAEEDPDTASIVYNFQSITHAANLFKYTRILSIGIDELEKKKREATFKPTKKPIKNEYVDVKEELRRIAKERHTSRSSSEVFDGDEADESDLNSPTSVSSDSSARPTPSSTATHSRASSSGPTIIPTPRQRMEEKRARRTKRTESTTEELRRVARERHGSGRRVNDEPVSEPEVEMTEGPERYGSIWSQLWEKAGDRMPWYFRPQDAVLVLVMAVLFVGQLVDDDVMTLMIVAAFLYFIVMHHQRNSGRVGADGEILRPTRNSSSGRYRSQHMDLRTMEERERMREAMREARYGNDAATAGKPPFKHRFVETLKSHLYSLPSPLDTLRTVFRYLRRRYDHVFILCLLAFMFWNVIHLHLPSIYTTKPPAAEAGTTATGYRTGGDGTDFASVFDVDHLIPQPKQVTKSDLRRVHSNKVFFMMHPGLLGRMIDGDAGVDQELWGAWWEVMSVKEAREEVLGVGRWRERMRIEETVRRGCRGGLGGERVERRGLRLGWGDRRWGGGLGGRRCLVFSILRLIIGL